jgi:hypothetical protein
MIRTADINILAFPEGSNGTTEHIKTILDDITRGVLSLGQLQTLLVATTAGLVAASTVSPPPLRSQSGPKSEDGKNSVKRLSLTRVEAAEAIGVCPRTLDTLTERKLLHPSRATGRPLYPIKELERFLDETK